MFGNHAVWALLIVLTWGYPTQVAASFAPEKTRGEQALATGAFLGGAVLAFGAHELGHWVANLALDNRPRLVPVSGFGFVPFFAISPELYCNSAGCVDADGARFAPGRPGMYAISTAGFLVQHIGSEIILSTDPDLRCHAAPFRKGVLAFNILLSVGYAAASMLAIEDEHGDAGGAARVAQVSPYVFSSLLVLPAVLDTYRYLRPKALWAAWMSRGSKATMLGLSFTF